MRDRRYSYSLDDMFERLSSLSYQRQLAVAFAVFSGLTLAEVKRLKWSDEMELNWRAEALLLEIQSPGPIDNVFWEWNGSDAVEMASLQYSFGIATLWHNWNEFVDRYKYCVPIYFKRLHS